MRRGCVGLLFTALLAWEPLLAEARSRAAEPELEPELPPVSAGRFRDKSKEAGSQDELDTSGKRIGRKSKRSSTDDAAPSLSNPLGKSKDKGKAADPEASSEVAPSGRKKDRKSRGGGDAETPAGGFLFQQTRADEAVEDALVEVSKASGGALASEGKKHKKKHKKGLAGLIQTVGDAVRGDLAAVGLVGAPPAPSPRRSHTATQAPCVPALAALVNENLRRDATTALLRTTPRAWCAIRSCALDLTCAGLPALQGLRRRSSMRGTRLGNPLGCVPSATVHPRPASQKARGGSSSGSAGARACTLGGEARARQLMQERENAGGGSSFHWIAETERTGRRRKRGGRGVATPTPAP